VTWHGFAAEPDLHLLISKSALCLFPSRYEGFGLTAVEAMAAGAVCVASEIPTYRDMITTGQNGFVVNFDDARSAADLIDDLLCQDTDELNRISQAAKRTGETYDWSHRVDAILDVYREVL
jgi:glycosyltransferase involved in cell wall biosynthesis